MQRNMVCELKLYKPVHFSSHRGAPVDFDRCSRLAMAGLIWLLNLARPQPTAVQRQYSGQAGSALLGKHGCGRTPFRLPTGGL